MRRPSKGKSRISVTIDSDLVITIRTVPYFNLSRFVNEKLREKFKPEEILFNEYEYAKMTMEKKIKELKEKGVKVD